MKYNVIYLLLRGVETDFISFHFIFNSMRYWNMLKAQMCIILGQERQSKHLKLFFRQLMLFNVAQFCFFRDACPDDVYFKLKSFFTVNVVMIIN